MENPLQIGLQVVVMVTVLVACSDDSDGNDAEGGDAVAAGVVPFDLLPTDTIPALGENSPWRTVSLEIESVPASVDAGDVLDFVVAIANSSDDVVDLDAECPAYFMTFGESSESISPVRALLNCESADSIAPGETERFAMEIELPSEQLEGSIYWRLEPAIADAASQPVSVE